MCSIDKASSNEFSTPPQKLPSSSMPTSINPTRKPGAQTPQKASPFPVPLSLSSLSFNSVPDLLPIPEIQLSYGRNSSICVSFAESRRFPARFPARSREV